MVTVAVVGAAGYTGGELCRLLLGHPAVERIIPVSRSGTPFEQAHPRLLGCGLGFHTERSALAAGPDIAFFCTPSGQAMLDVPRFLDRGCVAIDLGPDFRFADPSQYERTYGRPHQAPALLNEAVCGITELNRDRIRTARLIANPGCYVITASLALVPLLPAEHTTIHVNAVNGTTGASSRPQRELMHAEVAASILPYSLDGHRHAPELENVLQRFTGCRHTVDLSTAHGPFPRGIFLSATFAADRASRAELLGRYRERYGAEYFVRLVDTPRTGVLNEKQYDAYPRLANVVGSNFCHLGVDVDRVHDLIRVVAVTDNLVKGAAGSAIQNMNLLLDLPEHLGLTAYAL